jgi:hypothetical protein
MELRIKERGVIILEALMGPFVIINIYSDYCYTVENTAAKCIY